PSATDQLEQTTPRVMVMAMLSQVGRETVDALGQDCDLHLGRARVGLVSAVRLDDRFLLLFLQRHAVGASSNAQRQSGLSGMYSNTRQSARGDGVYAPSIARHHEWRWRGPTSPARPVTLASGPTARWHVRSGRPYRVADQNSGSDRCWE